jgi:superfamily II DNA helicase RecQ
MYVRVITLRYQEGLQGFSEDALIKATSGREVLEVRDYFFLHGNVPHISLVLLLGDGVENNANRGRNMVDHEEDLPEDRRQLYRDLKKWRNEHAKEIGKPSYIIARNVQLAEIARQLPRSLAALKEIDGIGEGFCRDYGAQVLSMMPDEIT